MNMLSATKQAVIIGGLAFLITFLASLPAQAKKWHGNSHDEPKGRTIVVQIGVYDADRAINGLLFAKHSCQFLPDAADSTIRVIFSNQGIFNALKNINHPQNHVPTLPSGDDEPKTAHELLHKLLGWEATNPPLRCQVEVAVSGFGLRTYGKTKDDLIPGIQVTGPLGPPNQDIQHPVFMSTPAQEGQPIVVVNY